MRCVYVSHVGNHSLQINAISRGGSAGGNCDQAAMASGTDVQGNGSDVTVGTVYQQTSSPHQDRTVDGNALFLYDLALAT